VQRMFIGLSLLLPFGVAASIWALAIQSIDVDSSNKATIISGVLSMLGGMVGAFSAYLIAREQITKQLVLQDQKDRSRVLLEVRLRKAEEVLENLTKTKSGFFNLQGSWTTYLQDCISYMNANRDKNIDYEDMKNDALIEVVEKYRDEFVWTYIDCYKFKPYFPDILDKIKKDHDELFKGLTWDINQIVFRFTGVDYKFESYKKLWNSIEKKVTNVDANFEAILNKIDDHINTTEKEIVNIILEFKK
jgi:hypothetical protein